MRAARNCDGTHGEHFHFGGVLFDRCPVAWVQNHPEAVAVWELYVDCCGGVICDETGNVCPVLHLPFEGSLGAQPAWVPAAFRSIAASLQTVAAVFVDKPDPNGAQRPSPLAGTS